MTTTSPNSTEQVLQAISDRLGLDLELNKLRIVYGINDCRNQAVIYGALASGKFRDSISDAQAAAILDAIDAPVSGSVPAANPKTGNLPNARIQIVYDEQLVLRQEKKGSNSVNPLYQSQVQEQDSQQPIESVQVTPEQTTTNKQVYSVQADGDRISTNQDNWELLLNDAVTNGWSPDIEAALLVLASFPEVALLEDLKRQQPSHDDILYDDILELFKQQKQQQSSHNVVDLENPTLPGETAERAPTISISNDQASLSSSQQQLNQSELDAQDLSFIASFKDWTIKDVRQIYEDTETIAVGTTFDLLSVAYRKQHSLDRDFDLDNLSDQASSLTVSQLVHQEFQINLEQVTPAYLPLSVEEYKQLCQEETDKEISRSFSSDNINPWDLNSPVETSPMEALEQTTTTAHNDRANLAPHEQEFIGAYKDWTLRDLRQASKANEEYSSIPVRLISSDCAAVLGSMTDAYGKKYHLDRDFSCAELPPQVFDLKVSEFVQQEFNITLNQSADGNCSVIEFQQLCQEEKEKAFVFLEAGSGIGEDPNDSEYASINYESFAKSLEELFAEAEQYTVAPSLQSVVTALEDIEATEVPQQASSEIEVETSTQIPLDLQNSSTPTRTSVSLHEWLESGNWTSDPETKAQLLTSVMSWAEWNKGNDGLITPTSVFGPAQSAVSKMLESNSKQFVQTLIEDMQNQPEQQRSEQQSEQRVTLPLEPERRSFSPLAATLDRAAHRVVDQAIQWVDAKLEAVERGLEKVGRWLSSRAEAAQNHNAAEIAHKLFGCGFNRTEEMQYQHQGFQVEKIENEKNSSIFILRDTQTERDLLKFRVEQQLHSVPRVKVLAKLPGGIAPETMQRLADLESNLSSVRGSDRGEEQRSQNVERFAQVARLVNEFGSTRNSHYIVDSGKTESGEDWLRVTAKGSRGVIYEQTGSEVHEDLRLWDFRRADSAYATVETPVTASQQTNDQER